MSRSNGSSVKWFAAMIGAALVGLNAPSADAFIIGDNVYSIRGGEQAVWEDIGEDDPMSVGDATLAAESNTLNDAYDSFWGMYIAGNAYNPTAGLDLVFTRSGALVQGAEVVSNGIAAQQKFVTYSNAAVLGVIFSLRNVSGVATTVSLEVYGNLGSDGQSTLEGTSGGDLVFDTNDNWIVTDGDTNDPVNGLVYGNAGGAIRPKAANMTSSNDDVTVFYDIPLAPGETKTLLFFSQLSWNITSALARAQAFNDVFAMQDLGLFAGFNAAELGTVCNWLLPSWESANDLNGDGISDLGVASLPGYVWYFLLSGNTFAQQQFGFGGTIPVTGDFDGDGKTDPGVYDPASGTWYLLESTDGITATQFGYATATPVPGDYDGDGVTDMALFDDSTREWFLMRSTLGFVGVSHGALGGAPVQADYDGNGTTDLATFDPATAEWSIFFTSSGLGTYAQTFGVEGLVPVPADYDGDGAADIAVYEEATGTWYIQGTLDGFWTQQFGFDRVIPVPGDYDGDKASDFGVYDPVDLKWYTLGSLGYFTATTFGVPDGVPVGGQ